MSLSLFVGALLVGFGLGGMVATWQAKRAVRRAKAAYVAMPSSKVGWEKVVEVDRALRDRAREQFKETSNGRN